VSRPLTIAIDGPSGSGKSTLGRALARRLGLPYVDTGAMYRAVGWAAARAGLEEPARIIEMLPGLRIEVATDPDDFRVRVDGADVTGELRDPAVGNMASRVATIEEVRAWLVPQQRRLAAGGGVVEGRDIGTVVLPDADVKFFLTSEESTRMARRAAQLGLDHAGPEVAGDVRERDRIDSSRRISPLRPAADAIMIDSSDQTVEESLAAILEHIEAPD
jgi:cytidylate kinase